MTSTEENYIKTIFHLGHGQSKSVQTSEIAELLSTTSASVTDMLKKLSDKNLVEYERYKGVRVTRKGEKAALNVIRRHRLWEVFLTDVLKFKWDEVHPLAEELEHVSSDELVKRLDAFLGHPKFDPHGDPIPDDNGKLHALDKKTLSGSTAGRHYIVNGVSDHSGAFLRFLEKKGLMPGVRFFLIESDEYDKSHLLSFDNGEEVFISNDVARHILIHPNEIN